MTNATLGVKNKSAVSFQPVFSALKNVSKIHRTFVSANR